jgi:hypothetical protein
MQKRYEVRRSTIIPTEVMAPYWNEPLDLVAADLSPRGMYLLSEEMPRIGEYLFCSFAVQGEVPEFNFFSRVKRVNWHRRKTEQYRPGFGVEFLDAGARHRLSIRNALRGLPPPVPSRSRVARVDSPLHYTDWRGGDFEEANWRETNRRLLSLSPQKATVGAWMGSPIVHRGIKFVC